MQLIFPIKCLTLNVYSDKSLVNDSELAEMKQ
jgi:hypothetical protein